MSTQVTTKRTSAKNTKTTERKAWVHHVRIASFKKSEKQGFLTPVNKPAKRLARKLGKRTLVTPAQLAPYQGYYKIQVYTVNNVRRTLKV